MKFIKIIKSDLSTPSIIHVVLKDLDLNRERVSSYWHLYKKQNRIALYNGDTLISFVEDEDDIIPYILEFYTGKPVDVLKIKLENKVIYRG